MARGEGEKRWADALLRAVAAAEGRLDVARYRASSTGSHRLVVVPYRGFGNTERLWVKGRVLREPRLRPSAADDPLWRNVLATWRRFESDEVPHARVRLSAAGVTLEVDADDEGYFETWIEPRAPLPAGGKVPVELELLSPWRAEPVTAATEVLLPPPSARLAVISDVDDTVVPTGAGRLLRMARTMLVNNAHTRAPFPGVAAFYRALAAGRGAEGNPFLYVSSGPWNLYDLLVEAFRLHGLPAGALVLRDWGLTAGGATLPTRHHGHKLGAIRKALDLWPSLPFLLVGDSGQADPEIYRQIAAEHRGRVLAIYIRDVGRDVEQPALAGLAAEVEAAGSSFVVAPTAWELASHAAARGWLAADTLPSVAAALGRDAPPA
jgi:phosphatidate phosphatase APP1